MNICGIYKITNKETNKIYIGQSIDIFSRWRKHYECQLDKWHKELYKFPEKFSFEILELCDKEKLDEREAYYIKLYNSYLSGYNRTPGNPTGYTEYKEYQNALYEGLSKLENIGRPKKTIDNLQWFLPYYKQWKNKEINKKDLALSLKISRPTLDKYIAIIEAK